MTDQATETDTASCPLCEARREAPASPLRIGCAFGECWRCGRHITVPGTTEWDFHERMDRRRIIAARARFVLAGGLVVPLVHLLVTLTTPRGWTGLDALIALAAGWLAVGLWETARLMGEINRSRRRVVGDPMYRAKLVERGITESREDRGALGSP